MIPSWSYTRLVDFESCPLKAKLKYLDKVPDPSPRPAADRGTEIHLMAEEYVQHKNSLLPQPLKKFEHEFTVMREHFHAGRVSLEGEWGFNNEWEPTTWKAAWGRIKADAVVTLEPTHAAVIDYKTGKKFGNEIKHGEQLQLYSLAVFLRNPKIQKITAELWYIDLDDLTSLEITRGLALTKFLKFYDRRARRMTECKRFEATPNLISCKWCPYKPSGTGHCKVGVE